MADPIGDLIGFFNTIGANVLSFIMTAVNAPSEFEKRIAQVVNFIVGVVVLIVVIKLILTLI